MSLNDSVAAEELSSHRAVSDVVLIDPSGSVNVCASVGHVFIEQVCEISPSQMLKLSSLDFNSISILFFSVVEVSC